MIQLQLFIEGEQVELHDNESVTLTQSLQDILDIQKVFTEFTRTFNVPASKNNNKIFKHFYNPDILALNFSPKDKKKAELFLNYKPFKKGFVKYESVQMTNNEPENYRLTFFGEGISIKDLFKDDKLQDITELNKFLTYSGSEVIAQMQDGRDYNINGEDVTDALIYPLITHTDRLIYNSGDDTAGTKNLHVGSNSHGLVFDQLKPAFRVHGIILAIQKHYNISFSDDFFVNTNAEYFNLYLWMQKQKGSILNDDNPPTAALHSTAWTGIKSTYDNSDPNRALSLKGNPSLGKASGFYLYGNEYRNDKSYKGNRFMVLEVTTSVGVEYTVEITQALLGNRSIFHESTQTSTGTDKIITLTQEKKLEKGFGYGIRIRSASAATFTVTMSVFEGTKLGGNFASATNTFTTAVQKYIYLKDQMPDIKVIDFLTALFKMFNLTSFFVDNTIKVQPLQDFYAASTTVHDITEHLDLDTSEVTLPIPYDNISFKYEGNETFFTAFHNQYSGINWGHLSTSILDEVTNKEYKITLPFEHMKFERLKNVTGSANIDVQWGWSVNTDQESILTKPTLFYGHKITSGTAIGVMPSAGGSVTSISNYYVPSNLSNPTSDTQSIHWGVEKNEYTNASADKSLFATYYRDYITEIFDDSRRIFKFKAYLPISILLNLQLNDRIIIFNTLYKINKIVTNFETGLSNLELLNEVSDFDVPTDNIINDAIKTIDNTALTADSTIVTADNTLFRL